MSFILFSPHSDDPRYFSYGSSKDLIDKLFSFIDNELKNISDVYLCSYLYNNEVLHNKMKYLATNGISVKVISIPLEGYDNRNPKNIIDPVTKKVVYYNATKYSLAQTVYDDIAKFNNPNYSFYVFGHTYVRSPRVKKFARGTLPFSLHAKSIFIKMRDGRSFTGLTSSNLAVRDASKDELMILLEDTPDTRSESESFFNALIANSSTLANWHDPHPHYTYNMTSSYATQLNKNCFTAPFIIDSPVQISKKLSEIISTATKRIYICAEHLAAYNYYDLGGNKQPGLFSDIFKKCRQGIPVKCLSQTYVDADGNDHSQFSPQNPKQFKKLIHEVDNLRQCSCIYAVNKNIHAKFIVVDDTAIISTANYTPTEFLYGNVNIEHFEDKELEGISYSGIFSEVSHFIIINNPKAANYLIEAFNSILCQADTYIHHGPDSTAPIPSDMNQRYYIDCPYEEKDDAKDLGAKWDPNKKKWYYTSPDQEHLFQRWLRSDKS